MLPPMTNIISLGLFQASLPNLDDLTKTYFDRDIEKAFMSHSKAIFEAKTKPSLLVSMLLNEFVSSTGGNKLECLSLESTSRLISGLYYKVIMTIISEDCK